MKKELPSVVWALAGTVLVGALISFVLHTQMHGPSSERAALFAAKINLVADMRAALAAAAAAEKSAVLATTDEESLEFAREARAAAETMEARRAALAALVQPHGSAKEKESLEQLTSAFAELRRIDTELLDLAVRNSNLKASALVYGPAGAAAHEMDVALARILSRMASSAGESGRKILLSASGAQVAALRLLVLLPPHIAEESESKMKDLEARMAKEDEEVRKDLAQLTSLLPRADVDLAAAAAAYARFVELEQQVLKLSHENTNVRSLSISLNQKRKVTAACQEALGALEVAIEEARSHSVGRPPVLPR